MNILKFFQQFSRIIFGFFLIAGLQACGVSTEETPPGDTSTNIVGFSLVGNYPPVGITERFDLPMQTNNDSVAAFFEMSWEVESSDPYSVMAHISTDASVTFGLDDQIFLSTQCGSDPLAYTCNSVGDQECVIVYEPVYNRDINGDRIVNNNGTPDPSDDYYEVIQDRYFIRCPNGAASITQADISVRMQAAGFPAANLNNYIVVTVCNEAMNSCQTTITTIQVLDANP